MKNIACNLIYNNGDEGVYVGFNGRCDVKNIIYNAKPGNGRWCSQPECSCRQFMDRGFKGKTEAYPCNESYLFQGLTWNAGAEYKTGEPFKIKQSGKGKIALLTTRFPEEPESDRKIVGFYKIKEIKDQYQVNGIKKYGLRLTLDEARELNFWGYHKNAKTDKPMWKQGRFRYLEDIQIAAVLHDLKEVVQNQDSQSMISELLESDFSEFALKRPDVEGALDNKFTFKVAMKRKYGKGGESAAHKRLKNFVADNPKIIGLKKSEVEPHIEHKYVSGDRVDILFSPKKGSTNTVVEVELDNVLPGIHQAIKYRVLRCSQLGVSLNSKNVKATVVAWEFTAAEEKLCKKYGIDYFAHKV